MSIYQSGDIFLVDSSAPYAKMVKFLMRSSTVWHYIVGRLYEAITRNQAPLWLMRDSLYYHAGMVISETHVIEQQKVVEYETIKSAFSQKNHIVIRRKDITPVQQTLLASYMIADLGKGYDILLILGKTLTWLTGITLFSLFINAPHKEICVNRVAKEYYKMFKETWGHLSIWKSLGWSLVTTTDIDYYAKASPELYTIVEEMYES
jgi:hypothetical protein